MTDKDTIQKSRHPDMLYVPPLFWRPMDLSTLKPGGFRRALNGAGMIWLSCLWITMIVVINNSSGSDPAQPSPPFWTVLAFGLSLTAWQLYGWWRICSLPSDAGDRKREMNLVVALQSLVCGFGVPAVFLLVIALLALAVAQTAA